jgi:Kef-type K+ transport system membrane component KefB
MRFNFFLALLICIALPALLGVVLRTRRVLPAVFVQLLLGIALQQTGALDLLGDHGVDLRQGPLADSLKGLGWLGVSLLIAMLAADAAPDISRATSRFLSISIGGFATTGLCGAALAYGLVQAFPLIVGRSGDMTGFVVGVGVALAVTALPVLLSIMRETGIAHTVIGKLASNCASLDDLWLWLGLAVALSFTQAAVSVPMMCLQLAVYLLVMFLAVPRLVRYLVPTGRQGADTDSLFICLTVLFCSAAATDAIGLHAIFGAYVAGAVIPRHAWGRWKEWLELTSINVLLPLFFVMSGVSLKLDFSDPLIWQLTLAATAVGVVVKFSAVALVGRVVGLKWPDAVVLGVLMQCKGMMELVAVNVLYEASIISQTMYSALALMAVLSTFITAPLLRLLRVQRDAPVHAAETA